MKHKWIKVYSSSPKEIETCRICGWWHRDDGKYCLPKIKRGWIPFDFEPPCKEQASESNTKSI